MNVAFGKKDGYQRPHLQLLRVCKQIHAEAEEFYLSKNVFMLPDHFMYHNPGKPQVRLASIAFGHVAFAEKSLFSNSAGKYLKNLSLPIHSRKPAPRLIVDCSIKGQNHLTPTQRILVAHDHALQHVQDYWMKAINTLFWLFKAPERRLNYPEIDVTNAYCPIGCCRMTDFISHLLASTCPKHVVIRGVRDQEEQKAIVEHVRDWYQNWHNDSVTAETPYRGMTSEQIWEMHDLLFGPELDTWEKFRHVTRVAAGPRIMHTRYL